MSKFITYPEKAKRLLSISVTTRNQKGKGILKAVTLFK